MTNCDEVEVVSSWKMPMARMVGLLVINDYSFHGNI